MEPIVIAFTVVFAGLLGVFAVRLLWDRLRFKSLRGVAFNREIAATLGSVKLDPGDGTPMDLTVHRLKGEGGEPPRVGLEAYGRMFRKHYFHMITLEREEALRLAGLLERIG